MADTEDDESWVDRGCSPYDEIAPVSSTVLKGIFPSGAVFTKSLVPSSDTSMRTVLGDYPPCFHETQKTEYIRLRDSLFQEDSLWFHAKVFLSEEDFIFETLAKVALKIPKYFKSEGKLTSYLEYCSILKRLFSSVVFSEEILLAAVSRIFLNSEFKNLDRFFLSLYTKNKSEVESFDSLSFLSSLSEESLLSLDSLLSLASKQEIEKDSEFLSSTKNWLGSELSLEEKILLSSLLSKEVLKRKADEIKIVSSVALGIGYGVIGYGEGGYGI